MNRWRSTKETGRPKISKPTCIESYVRNFKYSLLVICKYNFSAENTKELSIKKGDILKVLDRPGNGWLLVQFVDTVNVCGLIPVTYVEIAVNDPIQPITLQWLHQIDNKQIPSTSMNNTKLVSDIKDLLDIKTTGEGLQSREIRFPTSTSIDSYQLLDNRYLYKVEVTYSDNTKEFVLRYYQDFYNLHASLLDILKSNSGVPKLPEPMPSANSLCSRDLVENLSRRCDYLSRYLNQLLMHDELRYLSVLSDWLDITYNNLGDILRTDESLKKKQTVDFPNYQSPSIKYKCEELSHIYDQYNDPLTTNYGYSKDRPFSIEKYHEPFITPPKLTINTSLPYDYADSTKSLSESSIFSDNLIDTPTTPLTSDVFVSKTKSIKFKIIIKNGDMVALKLLRLDITSITDLKRLVYAKIPHENLYIKFQDFEHIDSSHHNIIQALNENEKILLKAI